MPLPEINRPDLPDDKRKELETYLLDHFRRAEDSRKAQLDDKYRAWQAIYDGIPFEKTRNQPWYKSSNFVVKLVQIYADTFLARTLNILFATKPLYTINGFPREMREGLEYYFNMKAVRDWKHYALAKQMIHSGNKNGTAPLKTVWHTWDKYIVEPGEKPGDGTVGKQIITYDGPLTRVIPFDDWNCYPITANSLDDVLIKFHKQRYVEAQVRRKIDTGKWKFTNIEHPETTERQAIDGLLKGALFIPDDAKRKEEQENAGFDYLNLQELQAVECHLDYPTTNDPDRYYSIVALIIPKINKLVDVWYDEYAKVEKFALYRPFPREDLIFGQSIAEKLDQSQEEASCIHNDRRNNATLANSVMFKVRAGSQGTPNASTNFYPGKVWTLEDLDDFDVINNVGR